VSYAAEPDPLCYPGTSVLINLLDITNPQLLEEAEVVLFVVRAEEPPDGGFDLDHYLELHRHLFQDIYSWAGQIRTIRIGKDGNWFCYPEHIQSQLRRVFAELGESDVVARMTAPEFAVHVGHFLAELNAVHPFREGNGRTQLAFVAMLAKRVGFGFNAEKLVRERVMQAMIESFGGDETRLVALLREIIS
jgi:cell filamentation protein